MGRDKWEGEVAEVFTGCFGSFIASSNVRNRLNMSSKTNGLVKNTIEIYNSYSKKLRTVSNLIFLLFKQMLKCTE